MNLELKGLYNNTFRNFVGEMGNMYERIAKLEKQKSQKGVGKRLTALFSLRKDKFPYEMRTGSFNFS